MLKKKSTPKINADFAFRKGMRNLKVEDVPNFKSDAMHLLAIKSRPSLIRRKNGIIQPNPAEKKGLEELFKKYGVPRELVWGA